MNIKNKIIAVLLISVVVCASTGYYLYNSRTKQLRQIGIMELNHQIIPNPFDNSKEGKIKSIVDNPVKKKSKHSYDYSVAPSSQLLSKGFDVNSNVLSSNLFRQSPLQKNYSRLSGANYYIKPNKESEIYVSRFYSNGTLAYSGSARRSATDGNSDNSGFYADLQRPLAVPFSNNGVPVTSPGTILFDPGVEKQDIEEHTIPVGDGLGIILLLAGAYTVFIQVRKR